MVYADVILNTAKEASMLIMAAERKAIRFHYELVASKEEALLLMIRQKQIMDSKINEVEMTSLTQQRIIDELEAQLQEAEDIVRDLREELREIQSAVEKTTHNQLHGLNQQLIKFDARIQEEISEGDKVNNLPVESPTTAEMNNSTVNQRNEANSICNPDSPSILLRSKEPELYRNGCTQKIRTLTNMKLPLSGQIDDLKDEIGIREDQVVEEIRFIKPCSVQGTSVLETPESGFVETSETLTCNMAYAEVNVPVVKSISETCGATDLVHDQVGSDRFLKYTFTRKRKKGVLGNKDGNDSFQESTSKQKVAEAQNDAVELHDSSMNGLKQTFGENQNGSLDP